jgi:hypothetical protein
MRADFEVFRNPDQEAKDFVQVANESDDARLVLTGEKRTF